MSDRTLELLFLYDFVFQHNYAWKTEITCTESKLCSLCSTTLKGRPIIRLPCSDIYHFECVYENIIRKNYYNCHKCNVKFAHKKSPEFCT
jgi:hypothetical protein